MREKGINNLLTWQQILVVLICIAGFIFLLFLFNDIAEDAFISFRYAENAAHGEGLVYNPGERVEGYTNFLWVIVIYFFSLMHFPIPITAQITSVFFAFLTILIFFKFLLQMTKNSWTTIAGISLLALNPCFARWSMSGMEVTMYSFFIVLTLYLYFSPFSYQRQLWSVSAAAATLTRPEGIILFLFLFIIYFFNFSSIKKRYIVKIFLLFAIPILIHLTFRWFYYGALLPNTFQAKIVGISNLPQKGIDYLINFLLFQGYFLFIIPYFFLFLPLRKSKPFLISCILTIIYSITVVFEGGDFYDYFRFLTPYIPLWIISLSLMLDWLTNFSKERSFYYIKIISFGTFILIILLSIDIFSKAFPWRNEQARKFLAGAELNYSRKKVGMWLRQNCPPNLKIATNCAGIIPYYSGLHSLDTLGITNSEVAHAPVYFGFNSLRGHEKFKPGIIFEHNPDLVIPANGELLPSVSSAKTSLQSAKTSLQNDFIATESHLFSNKDMNTNDEISEKKYILKRISEKELILLFKNVFPLYINDRFLFSDPIFRATYKPIRARLNGDTFVFFKRTNISLPKFLIRTVKIPKPPKRILNYIQASRELYRGQYYNSIKDYKKAFNSFQISLKLFSYRYILYNQIGVVAYESGDLKLALTYFRKANKYFPENKQIRQNLLNIESKLRDINQLQN